MKNLFALILLGLVCNTNSTPHSHWKDSSRSIHTFLTFDGNADISKLDPAKIDFVWGSNRLTEWKNLSSEIVVSRYLPYMWDWAGHNMSYWKSIHPDWIVYKCDRVTPAVVGRDRDVPLDITNPEVVAYQLEFMTETAKLGYDAIGTDCFSLYNHYGACGIWKTPDEWVQLYDGKLWEQAFANDSIAWAGYFGAMTREQGMLFIPNLSIAGLHWYDPNLLAVSKYIDGALSEEGYTMADNGMANGANYMNKIMWAINLQKAGKAYYPINEWQKHNLTEANRQYILASYLLSKNNASAVYTENHGYGYGYVWPEYYLNIGMPLDEFSIPNDGVLHREYENAIVIVNSNANGSDYFMFDLPKEKTYVDMFKNKVSNPLNITNVTGYVLFDSINYHHSL